MTNFRRKVPGFPNYFVTMTGRVENLSGHLIQQVPTDRGYMRVQLYCDGKRVWKRVHQAVLEAFVGPCPEGMECCHNDGIRSHNSLHNLRWDTRSANAKDRVKHNKEYDGNGNLRPPPPEKRARGEKQGSSKLTEERVLTIRRQYESGEFNQYELAKMNDVSQPVIFNVVHRKTWKHI